jgi:hypothetical protein
LPFGRVKCVAKGYENVLMSMIVRSVSSSHQLIARNSKTHANMKESSLAMLAMGRLDHYAAAGDPPEHALQLSGSSADLGLNRIRVGNIPKTDLDRFSHSSFYRLQPVFHGFTKRAARSWANPAA